MSNIVERLVDATIEAAFEVPFRAGYCALMGYIYAKFADLPAGQVAKAWAIWGVAESSIIIFATAITTNDKLIVAGISTGATVIGIHELQKRNLIGTKIIILIVAWKAYLITNYLLNGAITDAIDDLRDYIHKN